MSWSRSTFKLKTLPRSEKLVWPFLGHRWGDSCNDCRGKGTLHESLLFVIWQAPSPNCLLHQLSFPSAALWPWQNMSTPRCGLHLVLSAEIDFRGYSVDPTNLNTTENSTLYWKKTSQPLAWFWSGAHHCGWSQWRCKKCMKNEKLISWFFQSLTTSNEKYPTITNISTSNKKYTTWLDL